MQPTNTPPSTETTTFHVVGPEPITVTGNIPRLHTPDSTRLTLLRYINKLNKQISAHVDLKNTLYGMNMRANIIDHADRDYTPYPDHACIPQWMQGVDERIQHLRNKRDVLAFNAGEDCDTVPDSVDDLKPDFEIRGRSLRDNGKNETEIAEDRYRLQRSMVDA